MNENERSPRAALIFLFRGVVQMLPNSLLRAIRLAPMTPASVPSAEVTTGTFWLISLSEYLRMASSTGWRKW